MRKRGTSAPIDIAGSEGTLSIKRIDHVAIVVDSLEAALTVYRDTLGMSFSHVETIPEQGVRVGFLPAGDSEIELLEPLDPDSGIGKYLSKRGEGLHHICLEVTDIEATLDDLIAKEAQLIDRTPKTGAHGRIAFVHPKGAHGVLIELIERQA